MLTHWNWVDRFQIQIRKNQISKKIWVKYFFKKIWLAIYILLLLKYLIILIIQNIKKLCNAHEDFPKTETIRCGNFIF